MSSVLFVSVFASSQLCFVLFEVVLIESHLTHREPLEINLGVHSNHFSYKRQMMAKIVWQRVLMTIVYLVYPYWVDK